MGRGRASAIPPRATPTSPRVSPWYPGGVGGGARYRSSLLGEVTQYTGMEGGVMEMKKGGSEERRGKKKIKKNDNNN